jgi:hypothetical protein
MSIDTAGRCVFGLDGSVRENKVQNVIHRTKLYPRSRRIAHSRLKHMVANKIRLHSQAEYFDYKPCVIIIPIMTVKKKQRMEWRRIFRYCSYREIGCRQRTPDNRRLGLPEYSPDSNNCFYCYLRVSCISKPVIRGIHSRVGVFHSIPLWHCQKKESNGSTCRNWHNVSVQLAIYSYQISGHTQTVTTMCARIGHPSPDPMLLGYRGAINWCQRYNQQMLAAAEPLELSDESDSYDFWR